MAQIALRTVICLIFSAALASPAVAQEGYLKGDTFTCKAPPLRLKRPHDSWLFVDIEKAKAKRREEGLPLDGYGTLKFQLFYGAARANIFVHAWNNPLKVSLERVATHHRDTVVSNLRDGEVKTTKKVRVGKQVGTYFEISGNVPDPTDNTKLKAITILTATAYRDADKAVVTLELRFDAGSPRAKDLAKDFKKLLKKAKF